MELRLQLLMPLIPLQEAIMQIHLALLLLVTLDTTVHTVS